MTATDGATLADRLLDAALGYAALGWRIFPVRPGTKIPLYGRAHANDQTQAACPGGWACGRMGHGFKDATTDPDRLIRWWTRAPHANIGVATGSPAGTGTSSPDVLDVDVKAGAPGPATFEQLRAVGLVRDAWAAATTPSGGWHYFYDGTIQQSATLKKAGVDFRSCGGYVLATPSVVSMKVPDADHEGGWRFEARPYGWSWMHLDVEGTVSWSAIRDHLNPPPPPRNLMRASFTSHAEALIAWFAGQVSGNRNNALYWAACRILESGYDPGFLDPLEGEARRSGLDAGEVRKTIISARRRVFGGEA